MLSLVFRRAPGARALNACIPPRPSYRISSRPAATLAAFAAILALALPAAFPEAARAQQDWAEQEDEARAREEAEAAAAKGPPPELLPSDPAAAAAERLEQSFAELKDPDEETWRAAERRAIRLLASSGSDSFDLLLERGRDAIDSQNLDAAVAHLTDLVTLAPSFSEGWLARAEAYARQQDWGRALADLAEAIASEPRHFGAYAALGAVLMQLDEEAEALAAFRKALEIHPNYADARSALEQIDQDAAGFDI